MDLGLAGKNALVSGGSAGLGFGCAKALIEAGANVMIASRSTDRLQAAAASLGEAARFAVADVSDSAAATELVATAIEALGSVDILIANAGGPPPGTFASTELTAYQGAFELNLLSTVALCKAAVPPMQQAGWGRVVAITSVAVREPNPMLILSNTARAGTTAFLKTLAREVAPDGVTINSLQPGLHATDRLRSVWGDDLAGAADRSPSGTLGDPDDFGKIAAFLCSDAAKFITGAAIPVDGGESHGLQ